MCLIPALAAATAAGMVCAQVNGKAARIELDSGTILASDDYALPRAALPNGTALFPTDQPGTYALAVAHRTSSTG